MQRLISFMWIISGRQRKTVAMLMILTTSALWRTRFRFRYHRQFATTRHIVMIPYRLTEEPRIDSSRNTAKCVSGKTIIQKIKQRYTFMWGNILLDNTMVESLNLTCRNFTTFDCSLKKGNGAERRLCSISQS